MKRSEGIRINDWFKFCRNKYLPECRFFYKGNI